LVARGERGRASWWKVAYWVIYSSDSGLTRIGVRRKKIKGSIESDTIHMARESKKICCSIENFSPNTGFQQEGKK